MNKTRWTIALGVLVTLVVLGTDLAKASDAATAPLTLEPVDMPAATDSGHEHDRSDLLLSQG